MKYTKPLGEVLMTKWAKICALLAILGALAVPAEAQKRSKDEKRLFRDAMMSLEFPDYYGAIDRLVVLDSINPEDPEYSFYLGFCYYHTYQVRKALPQLQQAYLYQNATNLHLYLGETYHRMEMIDSARHHYQLHKKELEAGIANEAYESIDIYIAQCDVAEKFMDNPKDVKIVNLGGNVNTEHPEYAPVISADESQLIFTTRRPHYYSPDSFPILDPKDNFPYETLYTSTIDEESGEWQKPDFLGDTVNTNGDHNASIGLSPDGRILYMYKTIGGAFWGDIFKCEKRDGIWSAPVAMQQGINTPKYWEPSASITTDEKMFFFCSNRPGDGSKGGRDIFIVRKLLDGTWADPYNIGEPINDEYDQDSPFIHPDGVTLYFSSNGPNTMGGFDIFTSTFDPKTETWSEPVNMGYPINSTGDDIGFVWSADKTHGYFASVRPEGYGMRDLYKVIVPEASVNLVYLKGKVRDDASKDPISASVTILNDTDGSMFQLLNSSPLNGKFNVIMPPNRDFLVRVEAEGYLPMTKRIQIPDVNDYLEVFEVFDLKKTDKNVMAPIELTFNESEELDIRSDGELKPLVRILEAQPDVQMEIAVFSLEEPTDSLISVFETQSKADNIVQRLTELGADRSRITPKGYGYLPLETPELKELAKKKPVLVEIILKQPEQDYDFGEFVEFEEEVAKSALKPEVETSVVKEEDIEIGYLIPTLDRVHFATNSAQLTERSYRVVEEVATILKKFPKVKVEVGGHTDWVGDDNFNKKLSDRRSIRIVEQLVYFGISRDRLVAKGYGEESPIATNETVEGRALNRRTEFKVIGVEGQIAPKSVADDSVAVLPDGVPATDKPYDANNPDAAPPAPEEESLVKDVPDAEIKEGYTFEMPPIEFETASHQIKGERSYKIIKDMAKIMKKHTQIKLIEVAGHTDDRGSAEYNKALSQRRSDEVVKELIKEGIAKERMKGAGYGEDRPIDTNDTREGRQRNRRTEFTILKTE